MNCTNVKLKLNDYFESVLSEIEKQAISIHLNSCESCSIEFERHNLYVDRLRNFSVEGLRTDELMHIFKKAESTVLMKKNTIKANHYTKKRFVQRVASVAFFIGFGFSGKYLLDLKIPDQVPLSQIDGGIIWSDVQILIEAPQDINNARIVLVLPKGVHVVGYEGLREISWQTNFNKGSNGLTMPIWIDSRVNLSAQPVIGATLEYEGQSKQFDLEVSLDTKLLKSDTLKNNGSV